jgi:hypothetical protein
MKKTVHTELAVISIVRFNQGGAEVLRFESIPESSDYFS